MVLQLYCNGGKSPKLFFVQARGCRFFRGQGYFFYTPFSPQNQGLGLIRQALLEKGKITFFAQLKDVRRYRAVYRKFS